MRKHPQEEVEPEIKFEFLTILTTPQAQTHTDRAVEPLLPLGRGIDAAFAVTVNLPKVLPTSDFMVAGALRAPRRLGEWEKRRASVSRLVSRGENVRLAGIEFPFDASNNPIPRSRTHRAFQG